MKPTYEELAVQLANAESKCRELAAENAALKALCEDRRMFIMNGVQLGYIQVPAVETDPALETIRAAVSPQESTPATDSFLAGVRAQGVDEIAELYFTLASHEANRSIADSWRESARFARDHAAQLRKGGTAQSCTHCGGIGTCSEHGCTATDQMIERYRASKGADL